ncbi:MAG: membrane protein insertase YidC [Pseudomonadota bacterium]|nr:membrane protein insertase YidC [Pseudomonadota bacterium]
MKTTKTVYLVPLLAFLLVMLQQAWMRESRSAIGGMKAEESQKLGGLGKIKGFHNDDSVTVSTDKATVSISLHGGAVTGVSLHDFKQSLHDPKPFSMLSNDPKHLYIGQTGMSGDADLTYKSAKKSYSLPDGMDELTVKLQAEDSFGKTYTKTFRFQRGAYDFSITSAVENKGRGSWTGAHYNRFIFRHDTDSSVNAKDIPIDMDAPKAGWFTFSTYTGPAYYSDSKPYVKLPFHSVEKSPLRTSIDGSGWVAMQQRYFISAMIPQSDSPHTVTATWQKGVSDQDDETYRSLFNFATVGQKVTLAPGEKTEAESRFYVGPEEAKRLSLLAKGLELTVDYGWLWFISDLLFQSLVFIQHYLHSWGLSIIMLVCVVKLAFYKLSESSYKAMAKQKKLQPKIEAINEKYKDDAQKRSQELMDVYRKESINPISGCLPTLLQMPFFIALYYVLIESVKLRFEPFLWLPDLSGSDPFFILPILFCLSMLLMQKLQPSPQQDKSQANAMLFMPFAMSIMMAKMPSGLLVYWVTNNALSAVQQWFVMRHYK